MRQALAPPPDSGLQQTPPSPPLGRRSWYIGADAMGIDVRLQGEDGKVLAEVPDGKMTLARAATSRFSETRLLRYLMPYGDAVFNQAQAGDLRDDLVALLDSEQSGPLAAVVRAILPLVDRLAAEVHLYLWFIGD
jgi:hypothetical protein